MTTVDITQIVNYLLGIVLASVLAAIPIVVRAMLKRFGIANDADLADKLTTAADAAAGAAYKFALGHEGGLSRLDVHNAAVAVGVDYLTSNMSQTMQALGVTQANATAMVSARLGTLLAADPSVTAGMPPQAPKVEPSAEPTSVNNAGTVTP